MINDQQDKMEIPFDVEIPILIENSFSVVKHNSYACDYYAYMDIWELLIGDNSLCCKREDNNMHNENAVPVIHSKRTEPRVVGHVPFLYSSTFKKFLSLPGCWLLKRELTARARIWLRNSYLMAMRKHFNGQRNT